MKRYFILFLGLIACFTWSCDRMEEEITTDMNARLTFSTDTVLFDTLLTSVGSVTRRMRIFNPNENAVSLSSLALGRGEASPYTLTVNGREGTIFTDELILGKDSLLVLVKVFIDPQDQDLPFLVKDSLVVNSNGNQADIKLVAYGQDAIFINGGVFNCNISLTADRPYVIRNFALVDTLCTLTMQPGTRILMDNDAILAVRGTLLVEGDTANPVQIMQTRRDLAFSNVPGQWNGIFFLDGSTGNKIRHAEIRNGQIGLSAGNPENTRIIDLKVENTLIENMTFAGIFSVNSVIEGNNLVVNNCATYLVANFGGGDYTYRHCTFTNAPTAFIRDRESVQVADFLPVSETEIIVAPLNLVMENNIIWGNEREEFLIALQTEDTNLRVVNNLIRSDENFDGTDNFTGFRQEPPGFADLNRRNFSLDSLAFARGKGISTPVDKDFLTVPRDTEPDLGAFEFVEKQ